MESLGISCFIDGNDLLSFGFFVVLYVGIDFFLVVFFLDMLLEIWMGFGKVLWLEFFCCVLVFVFCDVFFMLRGGLVFLLFCVGSFVL